jgi:hypothetical protein
MDNHLTETDSKNDFIKIVSSTVIKMTVDEMIA